MAPGGRNWHIILADLALILFVLTLSALTGTLPEEETQIQDREDVQRAQFGPAQALFRAVPAGPTLGAWLDSQPRDPRATLTIHVRYETGEAERGWQLAHAMSQEAENRGIAARLVIAKADTAESFATLGYDTQR